ncbi:MAG: hypothetical protein Ct9H300mP14_04020 [Gammaproteobacteria bacterium]|nr:MAG: hypothetical protein Ct9H300mP14_04020 [Gammaproteobacteria bacterium]
MHFCGAGNGGISAMFEMQYPGIVTQSRWTDIWDAWCLTVAYKTGLIKPTKNFRLMIVAQPAVSHSLPGDFCEGVFWF